MTKEKRRPRGQGMSSTERSRRQRHRNGEWGPRKAKAMPDDGVLEGIIEQPTEDDVTKRPPMPAFSEVQSWVEQNMVVPSGYLMGQPYKLHDWQASFLEDALADGVKYASLTCGRKNGKTGLIAALLCAFLAGPCVVPNWRVLVASIDGKRAAELWGQMDQIVKMSPRLYGLIVKRTPQPGWIDGHLGSAAQFMAADRGTGHASGADMVVFDEAGLTEERDRNLWNNLRSSMTSRPGSRMVNISVRGLSPLFDELRDRSIEDTTGAYVWHEYAADDDCGLTDEDQIMQANPGIASGIKALDWVISRGQEVEANPADEADFRTYELNQPTRPDDRYLLTPTELRKLGGDPERAGPYILGVDLGGEQSMCGLCAFWPDTRGVEMFGAFPTIPDLTKRAKGDAAGEAYAAMVAEGSLILSGARTPDVSELIRRAVDVWGTPSMVVGDRYRQGELLDGLEASGCPRVPVDFRDRTTHTTEDVIEVRKAVGAGELVLRDTALLRRAASFCVVAEKGRNLELVRATRRGRIDVCTALVHAVGAGRRAVRRAPKSEAVSLGVL